MNDKTLAAIATELAKRRGHENVRANLHTIMADALFAARDQIHLEAPVPEVHGRIDALVGRTVIEIKANLDRELDAAEAQLRRYMDDRETQTGQQFVGLATDGLRYRTYSLRGGSLRFLSEWTLDPTKPREWLAWLDSVLALRDALTPDHHTARTELGKGSTVHLRAMEELHALWQNVEQVPEARLKYELWKQLLRTAYGTEVGDEELFLQHTYLTVLAKAIATIALSETLPLSGDDVLSGAYFAKLDIICPIEPDFFHWVLLDPQGERFVMRLVRQVARFRLSDIKADILKALYEQLIPPEQRHDLGEYYTPDWLAARVCAEVIDDPLQQKVIDPACGSGTFLFHAIRGVLAAAASARLSPAKAVALACRNVIGVDVHPVAVIFAGTTYLLALAETMRKGRPRKVHVPVYLSDSLLWNVQAILTEQHLVIDVPVARTQLYFPVRLAETPEQFDLTIKEMVEGSREQRDVSEFVGWLKHNAGKLSNAEHDTLAGTYKTLRELYRQGLDHIWAYVSRNLSRPLWLRLPEQQAHRIVGNPPWLKYSSMTREMQSRLRDQCDTRGLWVGGRVATSQDLSAYFYLRSAEEYLQPEGRIGMVLPFAALIGKSYAGFRTGTYPPTSPKLKLEFTDIWTFESDVQPLFKVPSCVMIAESGHAGSLPTTVKAYHGQLPRRDATDSEASAALEVIDEPRPGSEVQSESPYKEKFRDGATLYPRRLLLVLSDIN